MLLSLRLVRIRLAFVCFHFQLLAFPTARSWTLLTLRRRNLGLSPRHELNVKFRDLSLTRRPFSLVPTSVDSVV
ncbi:hypothetical protein EDC04DRAFT_3143841, partial [Pisolithus marmoratus]